MSESYIDIRVGEEGNKQAHTQIPRSKVLLETPSAFIDDSYQIYFRQKNRKGDYYVMNKHFPIILIFMLILAVTTFVNLLVIRLDEKPFKTCLNIIGCVTGLITSVILICNFVLWMESDGPTVYVEVKNPRLKSIIFKILYGLLYISILAFLYFCFA